MSALVKRFAEPLRTFFSIAGTKVKSFLRWLWPLTHHPRGEVPSDPLSAQLCEARLLA
jgi:hypothetical protein